LLNGKDMTSQPPHAFARAGLSRTFQGIRVLDGETVLANIRAAAWRETQDGSVLGTFLRTPQRLQALRRVRQIAVNLLALTGDAGFGSWLASDVSHSTRRMLELARALMVRPRILLLDEPTSGVSVERIATMKELIRREARSGCAVLLVDHDLDVIKDICDRVVVLDAGRKIYDGTAENAFRNAAVREAFIGA
jgi:branched-chain amino acid transport system ATP-binding protein